MKGVKKNNTIGKLIDLDKDVVKILGKGAASQNRKFKNYIENLLVEKSEELKLLEGERVNRKK